MQTKRKGALIFGLAVLLWVSISFWYLSTYILPALRIRDDSNVLVSRIDSLEKVVKETVPLIPVIPTKEKVLNHHAPEESNDEQHLQPKELDSSLSAKKNEDLERRLQKSEKTKPRIAIVTLYDFETKQPGMIGGRYMDILHLSLDNKFQYARRHSYPFFIDLHMWKDKDRPVAWSKLLAIAARLKEFDWVLWVDIDTLFMNWDIELESLIDDDYDLVVTKDAANLNSGVMLWKSSSWSINFLETSYDQTEFLIHKDIYEQRAIIKMLSRDDNMQHVKFLPQRAMNSYTRYHHEHQKYQDGDFLIHFAGCRHIYQCKTHMHGMFLRFYKTSADRYGERNLLDHDHGGHATHENVENEIEQYTAALLGIEVEQHSHGHHHDLEHGDHGHHAADH